MCPDGQARGARLSRINARWRRLTSLKTTTGGRASAQRASHHRSTAMARLIGRILFLGAITFVILWWITGATGATNSFK